MSLFFYFFSVICLLLSYTTLSLSYTPISIHYRRFLHQPFFPLDSTPPSQPPSSSPPQPKFPSSTNTPPFFPFYPSPPPPPPATTQATFPANISSLILPNNPSSKPNSPKIAMAILLLLFSLAIFSSLAFFLYRRRRRTKSSASDGHRLVPENLPSSSEPHKSGVGAGDAGTGSDFLYLGTVVSSRGVDGDGNGDGDSGNATRNSPYQKLSSPELHPLPPLSRQVRHNYDNAPGPSSEDDDEEEEGEKEEEEEEEEEFFSPRGSSGEKESPAERVFQVESVAIAEKCRSRSLNSSTPSYPLSSNSVSPVQSLHSNSPSNSASFSPKVPKIKSPDLGYPIPLHLNGFSPSSSFSYEVPKFKSPNSASSMSLSPGSKSPSPPAHISPERPKTEFLNPPTNGIAGEDAAGIQMPRPMPPPRPMTPSPPKRKPPSPSPPGSPPENNLDKNPVGTERISAVSGQNKRSQVEFGDFFRHPYGNLPPRPPPLPPAGFWDSLIPPLSSHGHVSGPPAHVTPSRNAELMNPMAVAPAELLENSDAIERNDDYARPKLKPLHWDKVRASSDRVMVWDQLKSSSFQLNEEMIETLFVCNSTHYLPKETTKRPVFPWPNQENRVLDPKKSQNIAILLRALNVTKEEVCEALLEGNTDGLGTELLETLLKMAPTKEEELKLKEYKDDSPFKLGPAERFLKSVLDIPFAFKRVDAMLYIANFDSEVKYLKKSFETFEAACEELRSSRMFMKLLEAVLKTGNRMNVGTNRGDAHAFKLETLLKLVDIKGTDGKTTLLHFVVQEIIRYEGSRLSGTNQFVSATKTNQLNFRDDVEFRKLGLQVVSGLSGELSNVKKAAAMDSDVLSSCVSKLAGGIGKIAEVMRLNDTVSLKDSSRRFSQAMNEFLKKAEEEIIRVQAQESVALSLMKEITEYFHGNSANEEAHRFRIFMIVRDFLSILDQVCKEVGKINERTIMSTARQFQVPANPSLPSVFPQLQLQRPDSSDDDDSSLSP